MRPGVKTSISWAAIEVETAGLPWLLADREVWYSLSESSKILSPLLAAPRLRRVSRFRFVRLAR